jgi:hypothetical protein
MRVVRAESITDLREWVASSRARFAEVGVPAVTSASLERPPADLAELPRHCLSTGRLSEVVEFRPSDLTITVGAGMRWSALGRVAAEEGLWLPPAGGTRDLSVGGWIASAPTGEFDDSFGPVRRHVLACALLLWDGRQTSWGRPVMKNVAGYDVTRLVCGSRARLGIVTSATIRLWPRPRVLRRFRLEGDALREAPGSLAGAPRAEGQLWYARAGTGSAATAVVTLVGGSASVSTRSSALESWAGERGIVCEEEEPRGDGGDPDAGAAASRSSGSAAYRIRFGRRYLTAGIRDLDRRLTHETDGWTIEAYPTTGVVRLLTEKQKAAGQRHAPAWLTTLGDAVGRPPVVEPALETPAVRVERGGAAEHAAARRMRGTGPRDIEGRWMAAFDGLEAPWQADYL